MCNYLNQGNDAFKISINDDIYIDKSSIISFVNHRIGKRKRFVCVSRPRRFGKSMTAEMLAAYYDKTCDSSKLFENLKIEKDDSYREHLNKYDVIFINVQQFLRKSGSLDNLIHCIEKNILEDLKQTYPAFIKADETYLPDALESIYQNSADEKKGFVFIIDEWDCIFRVSKENMEVQKVYLDFLQDLFKDRTYVKVAYMTGILPIKKYGTHSALNIFDEFSMIAPGKLAEYVGFTEEEVQSLCKIYHMDFEKTKKWYDGYRFKQMPHIYNPKSIIDAMTEEEYRSYWVNTETYEALQIYIDLDMDGLRQAIVSMLSGSEIHIDTGSFQNDMTTFRSKDDVLTLLVHLGYLAYDEVSSSVFIPNEEVRNEFIRAIKNGNRPELIKAIQKSDELLEATLRMDEETVAMLIEEAHSANASPLFYNNEQSLRSVVQLAYISRLDDYMIVQELPAGIGYADLVFLPRKYSEKPALVIELKWDDSAEGAIAQIKKNQYANTIANYGGEILLVGINYDKASKKHTCNIEKYICS